MLYDNQLNILQEILEKYDYSIPFNRYLVDYFRTHKNMGSRDRKFYSNYCYSFFRSGKSLDFLDFKNKVLYSYFLCNTESNAFLDYFEKSLQENIQISLQEKFSFIKDRFSNFDSNNIAPFHSLLCNEFSKDEYIVSQLNQPKVFIRVRKKFKNKIVEILNEKEIKYYLDEELKNCIAFEPNIKLQNIFSEIEMSYFEVQDRSSQFASSKFAPSENEYWWDACAGSGGKSLALIDQNDRIKLLCSDNRDTILDNLDTRIKNIGFKDFKKRKVDLLYEISAFEKDEFDGIILDAPCSGSGTWSRSPEMVQKFQSSILDNFYKIQTHALANTIQYLKSGKFVFYITCSVFEKENDGVVKFASENLALELIEKFYIKGREHNSDSMFLAIFKKK